MTEHQHLTAGRGIWPIDWRYLRAVILRTLVFGDDVKIRWLMAGGSFVWAAIMWFSPHTLNRPVFALMEWCAPAWLWGLAFFAHGAGAVWRILERRERVRWAFWINGLGVFVWASSTMFQNIVIGALSPTSALELFACFFLFETWVITGWGSKSTTA